MVFLYALHSQVCQNPSRLSHSSQAGWSVINIWEACDYRDFKFSPCAAGSIALGLTWGRTSQQQDWLTSWLPESRDRTARHRNKVHLLRTHARNPLSPDVPCLPWCYKFITELMHCWRKWKPWSNHLSTASLQLRSLLWGCPVSKPQQPLCSVHSCFLENHSEQQLLLRWHLSQLYAPILF